MSETLLLEWAFKALLAIATGALGYVWHKQDRKVDRLDARVATIERDALRRHDLEDVKASIESLTGKVERHMERNDERGQRLMELLMDQLRTHNLRGDSQQK